MITPRKNPKRKSRILEWRRDIVKFVRDNFQVVPDAWQEKALIAFANKEHRVFRLSMQACAGPGKPA